MFYWIDKLLFYGIQVYYWGDFDFLLFSHCCLLTLFASILWLENFCGMMFIRLSETAHTRNMMCRLKIADERRHEWERQRDTKEYWGNKNIECHFSLEKIPFVVCVCVCIRLQRYYAHDVIGIRIIIWYYVHSLCVKLWILRIWIERADEQERSGNAQMMLCSWRSNKHSLK